MGGGDTRAEPAGGGVEGDGGRSVHRRGVVGVHVDKVLNQAKGGGFSCGDEAGSRLVYMWRYM